MKTLLVSGLTGKENEIKDKFLQLADEKLKVAVKPEEVTVRKAAREGVPAQLVVTNIWTRNTCYRELTKLKGTNTFLSEDLTKEQSNFF